MNHHRNDKYHLVAARTVVPPQHILLATSSSSSSDKFKLPISKSSNNSGGESQRGRKQSTVKQSKDSSSCSSRNEHLCVDRKGFFDHLRPKSLLLSSCRVTIIQATEVLASYLIDQLEHESKLDEQLTNDEITHLEYESSILEFEETQWKKRWNDLLQSNKIYIAIGKFHLLTFLIRSYESLLWNVVKVDGVVMDMLTKDTYRVAVEKKRQLNDYNLQHSYSNRSSYRKQPPKLELDPSASSSSSSSSTTTTNYNDRPVTSTYELGRQMFTSCFYANAIAFFSDLTVQQCILLYGYYKFFLSKERQRKLLRLRKKYNEELKLINVDDDDVDADDEEEKVNEELQENGEDSTTRTTKSKTSKKDNVERHIHEDSNIAPWMEDEKAIIMLSFLRRSAQNTVVKAIGLVFASLGGAIGSMIHPGWGTLFGIQMGDAGISALLNE